MRVRGRPASRLRRRRILKQTKGQWGARHRLIRTASQAVSRGLAFGFAHRRRKKREFRALWITRLTAAVNQQGLLYSRFIHGLKKAGITLNRKELSELAIHDAAAFQAIVDRAKAAL